MPVVVFTLGVVLLLVGAFWFAVPVGVAVVGALLLLAAIDLRS